MGNHKKGEFLCFQPLTVGLLQVHALRFACIESSAARLRLTLWTLLLQFLIEIPGNHQLSSIQPLDSLGVPWNSYISIPRNTNSSEFPWTLRLDQRARLDPQLFMELIKAYKGLKVRCQRLETLFMKAKHLRCASDVSFSLGKPF